MANQRIILYRNTNAPAVILKFPDVDFTGYTAELVVTPAAGTGTAFTSPSGGLTINAEDETVTWQQAMTYVNTLSPSVSARADFYRVLGSYREKLAAFDVQIGGIGDYFETPTYVIQVPGIAGPKGEKGDKGDTGDTGDITPELEAALAAAEAAAAQAALYEGFWLDDAPAIFADSTLTYADGSPSTVAEGNYVRTRKESFSYTVAASDATDEHVTTAGGVKLYVNKNSDGSYNVLAFGAEGDGTADDTAALAVAGALPGVHIIPPGYECRITAEVVWTAGCTVKGGGGVFVDQTPYVRAFRMGSLSVVEDLTFRGTGVATARATLAGGQYGMAVASFGTAIVSVRNCQFFDFISESLNTGAALVMFSNGHGFSVSGCYVDESCDGFSDFDASYTTGDVLIHHNISYSNSDFFFGCATVGSTTKIGDTDVSVVSHHIVTDNIAVKLRWGRPAEGRDLGRHGIAAHYSIGESYLIAKGNLFGNLSRHGLYLRGPSSVATDPTGPNQIIGNIFRYCGQGEGSEYSSSIRVETTLPTTIIGNLSEKAGYLPDGTEGTTAAYDIECVRGTQNLIVTGNQLLDAKSGSILLSATVADREIVHNLIQGNNIRNQAFGIGLVSGVSSDKLAHIKVLNNDIELTGAAGVGDRGVGIWVESVSTSNDIAFSLAIKGNTVSGQGKAADQYGVLLPAGRNSPFVVGADISDNVFQNIQEGVSNWRYATNSESYAAHRVVGTNIRINRNRFVTVGAAFRISRAASSILAMVGDDNIYEDCDGGMPTTALSSTLPMEGRCTGIDASGNRTLQIKAAAAPAAQQWYVGDRALFAPVAGGTEGAVCTTAGTPGTWKTFGAISA